MADHSGCGQSDRGRAAQDGERLLRHADGILGGSQVLNKLVDQRESAVNVPLLAKDPKDDVANMPRENVRRVRVVDHRTMNGVGRDGSAPSLNGPGDQALVEALEQAAVPVHHAGSLPGPDE